MRDFERNAPNMQQTGRSSQMELNERILEQMVNASHNNSNKNGYSEWGMKAQMFMHYVTQLPTTAVAAIEYCEENINTKGYLNEVLPEALRAILSTKRILARQRNADQSLMERVLTSTLPDDMKYEALLEIIRAGSSLQFDLRRIDATKEFIRILRSKLEYYKHGNEYIKLFDDKVVELSAAIAMGAVHTQYESFAQEMGYLFAKTGNAYNLETFLSTAKDSQGNNILHKLARVGDHAGYSLEEMLTVIITLRKLGADINAVNKDAATPLILALQDANGHSAKVAIALLKSGAKVAIGVSSDGNCLKPLHLIALSENHKLVTLAISIVGSRVFQSLDFQLLGYESHQEFMRKISQTKPQETEHNYNAAAFGELSDTLSSTDSDLDLHMEDKSSSGTPELSEDEISDSELNAMLLGIFDEEEGEQKSQSSALPRRENKRISSEQEVIVISDDEEEIPTNIMGPIRTRNTTEGITNRYTPYNSDARLSLRHLLNNTAQQHHNTQRPIPMDVDGDFEEVVLASGTIPTMMRTVEKAQDTSREL